MNKKYIIATIIVIVLFAGAVFYASKKPAVNAPPDTTPHEDQTAGWETYSKAGVTFKYPKTLGTSYINTVDWPPQVRSVNEPFTCTTAGIETDRAGGTSQAVIGGDIYCVTKESEGAAGSMYTQYAYSTLKDGRVTYLTFSLRFSQCGNYNDPEKTKCENERTAFTIDQIVDQIVQTLSIDPNAVEIPPPDYNYEK